MVKMRKIEISGKNGIEIDDSILTASENDVAKMEIAGNKKILDFAWWFVLVAIVVLIGRVFYLSVVKGEYYREISENNRIRTLVIKAPRGNIYDRKGVVLARNIPSVDMVVIPSDLPKSATEREAIAQKISIIFGLSNQDVMDIFNSLKPKSDKSVLLKNNISREESLLLLEREKELPGISMEKSAIREYQDGLIFSHIIGYEGKVEKDELEKNPNYLLTDTIGKRGIEKEYEKFLRGVHGGRQAEVDSLGRVQKELGIIDPIPGGDIFLNIDSELQKAAYDAVSSSLEKGETKTAAVIVVNPRDGGVLALLSVPSFDNNLFTQGISKDDYQKIISDPDKPFFNRTISGAYPPGSTIKPLVAIAALNEGIIDQNTSVDCHGALSIGSYRFGDWKTHGSGIDVKKAIAESCDVFFYAIGGGYGNISGLGMSKMKKYENDFGFGEISGIDLPGEVPGFIPSEEWKMEKFGEKWYVGNSFHASIGQGFVTATPIQLVNYVSAIANGGILYKPRIVNYIKKEKDEIINKSSEIVKSDLVSKNILEIIKEGMRQTVQSGTAQQLKELPIPVAGKTGTAQFGTENKTHAWFVSFAPYENPEIAVVVLVEGESEGSSQAVPITKEIYRWYFENRIKNSQLSTP